MFPEKNISVIIVNFKSGRFLRKCLLSLEKNKFFKKGNEIVIVNNDFEEDIDAFISDFSSKNIDIKIINHEINIGWGSGANAGVKKARGTYLWFLNPDCELKSDNIGGLTNYLKKEKNIVLGTKLIDKNGKTQKWIAGKKTGFLDLVLNNLGIKRSQKIWNSEKVTECDWVTGGSLLVRKKLFEELGGFDENFFMYFEDMDFCKRVKEFGGKIIFFPHFEVVHINGGSYSNKNVQKKHFFTSQDYYFTKHNKGVAPLVRFLRRLFS